MSSLLLLHVSPSSARAHNSKQWFQFRYKNVCYYIWHKIKMQIDQANWGWVGSIGKHCVWIRNCRIWVSNVYSEEDGTEKWSSMKAPFDVHGFIGRGILRQADAFTSISNKAQVRPKRPNIWLAFYSKYQALGSIIS